MQPINPLLKLGNLTINPMSIAYINWDLKIPKRYRGDDAEQSEVVIHLRVTVGEAPLFGSKEIRFDSNLPEAVALRRYFDSSLTHVDLVAFYGERK